MAINVFGAGAVQSAYVSYNALNITPNSITLLWPTSYVNAPYIDPINNIHYDVLAASMQVTTIIGNLNTITLPNAMQSSVGQNFIITNIGGGAFALLKSNGDPLINVLDTGLSYWIQLTDNTTPQGVWKIVQFGAGESAALADDLAGNGLIALGTTLNTDTQIVPTNIIPTIDATYRAKLILWTGAVGALILPAINTVPAGYYVSFNNAGTAQITIQPGEALTKIDKQDNVAVEVQQSLTLISDGTNWWSLGFGQNQFAVTRSLVKDVSAGVNVILDNVEAANLIQNYIGALGTPITVFFPVTTNYWFINNLTTGLGPLSVQLFGGLGTSYVVPKGSKQIFYSDGHSLFPIPTALDLAVPLAIASGGTGAITQPNAANAILPAAVAESILVFRGGIWIAVPPGAEGSTLKIDAGIVKWV